MGVVWHFGVPQLVPAYERFAFRAMFHTWFYAPDSSVYLDRVGRWFLAVGCPTISPSSCRPEWRSSAGSSMAEGSRESFVHALAGAVIGVTGSGKSTVLRGLIHTALVRGDRHVVAGPVSSALRHFWRGDVILNPSDARSVKFWRLVTRLLGLGRIVDRLGLPGPGAALGGQRQATDTTSYQTSPTLTGSFSILPQPSTTLDALPASPCALSTLLEEFGGNPAGMSFCTDFALPTDAQRLLSLGGTGQSFYDPALGMLSGIPNAIEVRRIITGCRTVDIPRTCRTLPIPW